MEESQSNAKKTKKNNQQTKNNNNNKNSSSMMNLLLISKGRYAGMYTEVYSWKSIFIYFYFNLLTCNPILGLTAENDLPKLKW